MRRLTCDRRQRGRVVALVAVDAGDDAGLFVDGPVECLSEQISAAGVAGSFLDWVQQYPAEEPEYTPVLVPTIMAIAMSFMMSLVQTTVGIGFAYNLASAWLTSFAIGVAVAIPTATLGAPRAHLHGRLLTWRANRWLSVARGRRVPSRKSRSTEWRRAVIPT
jgi:Protein of unknown function (DUF2798)